MPYLTCPQCHATFHVGLLYAQHDVCPRCGTPFHSGRRNLRDHMSAVLSRRHREGEPVDWEAITGSQYLGGAHQRRAAG